MNLQWEGHYNFIMIYFYVLLYTNYCLPDLYYYSLAEKGWQTHFFSVSSLLSFLVLRLWWQVIRRMIIVMATTKTPAAPPTMIRRRLWKEAWSLEYSLGSWNVRGKKKVEYIFFLPNGGSVCTRMPNKCVRWHTSLFWWFFRTFDPLLAKWNLLTCNLFLFWYAV